MDNSLENSEIKEKIPESYSAPHNYWRPYQKEGYEFITNAPEGKPVIIEAPTGMGKSLWAAAIGSQEKVLVLCQTKDLLEQYEDLYGFSVIKGRNNYSCTEPTRVQRWRKVYGYAPTAADCPSMKECDTKCPYKQAKADAHVTSRVCTTYAYAWYSEWWHKRGGYLFADEAHNLAISVISGLAQLNVSEKQRRLWDLPKFPACSGTTSWAKDQVFLWLAPATGALDSTLRDMGDSKEKSKGTLLHRKLVLLKELLADGTWHIEGTNIGNINNPPHLTCRPINPSVFAGRLLGSHEKKVLMSATIGDAEMLAGELGITDYEFKSFPHNIPVENRPVYLVDDAPKMSYKSGYKDYERQADLIAGICLSHPHERILVHTTRWNHAQSLAKRLAKRGLQDRLYVPDPHKGRIEQMARLVTNIQDDLVTIGPSFWEGVSLDFDLCRVVIVAKVPFQNRGDPVVAARLRQPGGQKWDSWIACLKTIQGCGRAVRDEKDFAVSYIVDSNWSRVARFAPPWFNVET